MSVNPRVVIGDDGLTLISIPDAEATMLDQYQINVAEASIAELRRRIQGSRLITSHSRNGWRDGVDLGWLAEVLGHWHDRFDWRVHQDLVNRFRQVRGEVAGTTLHAVHEKGKGPHPFPLLLVHGWPDSILRFRKLIPLLTDPAAHGGDPADAFHIVAPSLPGFGYSTRSGPHGNTPGFGRLFGHLMEMLGYCSYGAHGGDLGSSACERLAWARPNEVVAIHLTDVPGFHAGAAPPNADPEELRYLEDVQRFRQDGGGYMHLQATRPWTAAVGLNDSPAGLAAWILEKFHAWSDLRRGFDQVYDLDDLLANVTLYWVTETIGTSFLAYRDAACASPADLARPDSVGKPVGRVPVGGVARR